MKSLIVLVLVLGAIAAGGFWYLTHATAEPTLVFGTATVKQEDLTETIDTTGTVEPVQIVDVGAQVTGPIAKLGDDPRGKDGPHGKADKRFKGKTINWSSPVYGPDPTGKDPNRQTILAEVDDRVYKAQLDQAVANRLAAVANEKLDEAKELDAKLEWFRAKKLRPDLDPDRPKGAPPVPAETASYKALADSDFDLAKANYDVAIATTDAARAAVKQAEAAQALAQTNLDYTKIKSPVNGTIIDRRVNVGQTVVGQLSAASVCLIGKDLKHIQVWAQVNEADVGRIHEGMPVHFTVDAYPKDLFHGQVQQVRLNATMTQNVVMYTVAVDCDNEDLRLMPYMTTNLHFEVASRKNVLQVPNAALRWEPPKQRVAADVRELAFSEGQGQAEKENQASEAEKSPGERTAKKKSPGGEPSKERKSETDRGRLWVKDPDGLHLRPVFVQKGLTDGTNTEVSGPDVKAGMEVVLGESRAQVDSGDTTNPFAPKLFKKAAKKKKE